MIYLASPYSHPLSIVRERRFHQICSIAGQMMEEGKVIYCPIAMGRAIKCSHPSLPTDWEYWKKFCTEFIKVSDKVLVAKMDGWDTSTGVTAEIAIAQEMGIPVEYMEV